MGYSSDPDTYGDFGPATPGFIKIPFNDINALEQAITPNTVAFLVEPIQGEAGVIVPDPGYLRRVREICTQNNVLMIADEIQTGFCRTGKRFACDLEEVKPDILLVGKALGGGMMPVSAALSSWDIMEVITPGSHGSTFGGNPLACAVGIAAIEVLEEEHLDERAAELGEYFMNRLARIESSKIKEVRGKGLLIGLEFTEEAGPVRPLIDALMERGILAKDTHEYTMRFAPALIVDKETLDWAGDVIEDAIMNL